MSNIGHLSEVSIAKTQNTDGIGLLRTEIDLMMREEFPSEEEQYHFFKNLIRQIDGKPVTIRTMDLGYDKQVAFLTFPDEVNSALGKRSFRLALDLETYQITQIKAIMRAAAYGDVKLMFPFITSIEDIRAAKRLMRKARRELEAENRRFDPELPVGMMVEVPAAAYHLDRFAREVQFFSVGTNDLVQYLCAADRNNPDMSPWYRGYNPGVLRFLNFVIQTAKQLNRPLSLCGEMAGDPLYTLFLVGCGVNDLSMSNPQVPLIKKIIRGTSVENACRIQQRALEMTTCRQIHDLFVRETEKILGTDIAYWTSKMS